MPYCSSCGTELSVPAGFCGNCGTSATGGLNTATKPVAASEQVIFERNGIFVSNSRYITGEQTYAMAGVTSVKTFAEIPSRKGPVIAMIFGGLFILGGIENLFKGNFVTLLFGLALFLLGLWIFKKRVPIYWVQLHTASGEQKANCDKDRNTIDQIVGALNQAIVLRG